MFNLSSTQNKLRKFFKIMPIVVKLKFYVQIRDKVYTIHVNLVALSLKAFLTQ